jgi:acetylornithine/succinyldiaminopimelate/putrescine aminotransferase
MPPRHPLIDTCEQILQEQLPNFLRLYLNPHVTEACYCLTRYVQTTWSGQPGGGEYQTFLANGFDEALGGAIKLARYCASLAGRPTTGLVLDPNDRLGPFASARLGGGEKVDFVPGLVVVGKGGDLETAAAAGPFGLVVLVGLRPLAGASGFVGLAGASGFLAGQPLVITCLDRETLVALRRGEPSVLLELTPDIVLFDESFVDRAVPFSAFTARKALYDHWNRPGKTTFHSTTFQPNTVSSLHFMKCLASADPQFHNSLALDLEKIHADIGVRRDLFRRLYSPFLSRATRAVGFDTADVRAAGEFILVNGRPIFDGVSGVACSVRGHNPATYAAEIQSQGPLPDCQAELASRLRDLTGLEGVLPAVSGATAVENALKVALVAQFPRRHVLALKAGFGGKTLLSLTGTANPAYKEHLDPLHAEVLYVDPFSPDALALIDAALAKDPVAVVQIELIQAVGGVRAVPERVVRHLEARRRQHGYLLLVDEVQTGLYRTGPFTVCRALGLSPDLLLLGKGTSDMMFPFALTLCSAEVLEKLDRAGSGLVAAIHQRYGYEFGYRTVLNVLRRAEELSLSRRVAESAELFARLLGEGLASCKAIRDVRIFGLLMGIELNADRWPQRWFRKRLFSFYLVNLLQHARYPVLAGFCQYEPNVLKITPPLTVGADQVRQVCATLTDVLNRPFPRLLPALLGSVLKSFPVWRKKHDHRDSPAVDALAR